MYVTDRRLPFFRLLEAARHWLIGSTTDRVVDHAHCAVMSVH